MRVDHEGLVLEIAKVGDGQGGVWLRVGGHEMKLNQTEAWTLAGVLVQGADEGRPVERKDCRRVNEDAGPLFACS